MISVAKILELLPPEGSVEIKKLEKMLKLTKKVDRNYLGIGLTALEKIGIVAKNGEDSVQSTKPSIGIKGYVRCSSKGYCFVVREDGEDDIYIREQYLNHAWHGDQVLVKIIRDGLKRRSPEGSVLCILERTNQTILASVQKEVNGYLATPLDERILSKIELEPNEIDYNLVKSKGHIYEIEILNFPIGQYKAKGKVLKTLSLNEGFLGDLEIIKAKNSIPKDIISPKVALKPPISKNRVDFTGQDVLLLKSWDANNNPPLLGLYAEPYSGGVKLWVHVPAISERINFGNKLDKWIQSITESLFTGNEWINLLSKSLLEVASFTPGKESEAITLELDITKQGNFKDWTFHLSTIKPTVSINNTQLALLKNKKPRSRTISPKLKPIKEHLPLLSTLIHAVSLVDKSLSSENYINFLNPHSSLANLSDSQYINPGVSYCSWKYSLDETDCNSIVHLVSRISNHILNCHLLSLHLPSISLLNPTIDSNSINEVIKSAIILGNKIELNDLGEISLKDLINVISDSPNQSIIEKSLRSLLPQKIFTPFLSADHQNDQNQDENLSLEDDFIETPWTSPSISYCDIINQNILVTLLAEGKNKSTSRSKDVVNLGNKQALSKLTWEIFTPNQLKSLEQHVNLKTCRLLNSSSKRTLSFQSDLTSVIETRKIKESSEESHKGVITGVQSYGFFVEVFPYESEGLVHVSTLDDDWYEYRSRQNMLIGRKNKKTFQIGDEVKIKVIKVDVLKGQIDLEVLNSTHKESLPQNTTDDTAQKSPITK